jgi:hypothetical protein
MRFKSPSPIILVVLSLFVLVASPGLLHAQQNASAQLREQAAKLQQDIEALKKSKGDLSGRISASLLSSLESEIQAKQSALSSSQQRVKQAEGLERDIVDLTAMRDKMQGRVSADLLSKLNEEVGTKQQALAKLSDSATPIAPALIRGYDPSPDSAPAGSEEEKPGSSTKAGRRSSRKGGTPTGAHSPQTPPAAAATQEKQTQPTAAASPAVAGTKTKGGSKPPAATPGQGAATAGQAPGKAKGAPKQPGTAPAAASAECESKPLANQPYEGQTWVTGKVACGVKVTVKVTVKGKEKEIEGVVDENGAFRASSIAPPLEAFQVVSFAVDKGKAPDPIAVKPQSTCESSSAPLPCLNQPYEGDTTVSGKVKDTFSKVDTIKVSGEKDKPASESIQVKDSTFTATLSHPLSLYDSVEADETDKDGNVLSGAGPIKVADLGLAAVAATPAPTPAAAPPPTHIPTPVVTLSPTSLTFLSRSVGDASPPQTVTLKNESDLDLTITSIEIAPPATDGHAYFTQSNNCGSTVVRHSACSISVVFKPTETGPRTATLIINDNAVGSPHRVWLKGGPDGTRLSPSRFIRIYEDTEGGDHPVPDLKSCNHCIQIYNPDGVKLPPRKTIQLSADEKSLLVVIPDINLMGSDLALNKLFITAQLVSGGKKSNVEVVSYSEVGKDQSTSAAQKGTAFESAQDIEMKLVDMSEGAEDVLKYAYCTDPTAPKPPGCARDEELTFTDREGKTYKSFAEQENSLKRDAESGNKTANGSSLAQRLRDRLRLHQQEVNSLATFFKNPTNQALVQLIGTDVLNIDRDTLVAIVTQYKTDVDAAFDSKSTGDAVNQALWGVLERTKIIYDRFKDDRASIRALAQRYAINPASMPLPLCQQESDALATMLAQAGSDDDKGSEAKSCALHKYIRERGEAGLLKLKNQIVPGHISLQNAGAKDGDQLTVTVEVRGEGEAQGIAVPFEIAIKRYGWKPQVADSFMFVHRQGLTLQELSSSNNPGNAGLNRVNFAPSPGVSFILTYLRRGDNPWDKFLRAMGPGIGMNVSFMNFNDPSFDQSTGKFTNTTGLNIQEGAGIVATFFDNKLQFSRGWNLNAARKRQYWAVGFGFIEITKEVAKYVKQK